MSFSSVPQASTELVPAPALSIPVAISVGIFTAVVILGALFLIMRPPMTARKAQNHNSRQPSVVPSHSAATDQDSLRAPRWSLVSTPQNLEAHRSLQRLEPPTFPEGKAKQNEALAHPKDTKNTSKSPTQLLVTRGSTWQPNVSYLPDMVPTPTSDDHSDDITSVVARLKMGVTPTTSLKRPPTKHEVAPSLATILKALESEFPEGPRRPSLPHVEFTDSP